MAGSGSRKKQDVLKNKAMLVVRNETKQEVTNVIFPNGITVGANGINFRNGLRVHGDTQVSGLVNAQGFKVNGQDLLSTVEFLFLDIDTTAVSFDDNADSSPSTLKPLVTITQSGQTATVTAANITATDTDGTAVTVENFSVTETSVGNSVATAEVNLTGVNKTKYPVNVSVSVDSRTSSKQVVAATGGEDAAIPATLILDLNSNVVSFENDSASSGTPATIGITATQSGQVSTLVAGDITAQNVLGNAVTVSSFSVTAASTGNSVATAQIAAPTNKSHYPVTITVSNDSLSSTKTVVAAIGGTDGGAGSNGTSAIDVKLTADSTAISYDSAGSNPSPSSITLTATSQNLSNGFFKFTGGGSAFIDEGSYSDGTGANVDTATFTAPSSYSATPYTMRVGASEANQSELAHDTLSIVSIKPGTDGTDGTDGTNGSNGSNGSPGLTMVPSLVTFTVDFSQKSGTQTDDILVPQTGLTPAALVAGYSIKSMEFSPGGSGTTGFTNSQNLGSNSIASFQPLPGSPSLVKQSVIYFPGVAGDLAVGSGVSGTLELDSNIANNSEKFTLMLYETSTAYASISNQTKLVPKAFLALDGQNTGTVYGPSLSYAVSLSHSVSLSASKGYTIGFHAETGTPFVASGILSMNIQFTYGI